MDNSNNKYIIDSLDIKKIDPLYFKYFKWTKLQKDFLVKCLDFLDAGGDFYDQGDNATKIKLGKYSTGEDIGTVCFSKNMQPEEKTKDISIENIVRDFGQYVDFPLYRGLSDAELNNIINFMNLKNGKIKKCNLAHSKAFSSDIDVAYGFAKSYSGSMLTVQKCKQKVVNIDELTYLAGLASYIYNNDIESFKEYYVVEKDDILSEREYSIPKNAIFEVVDLDNLIFNVI